MKYKPPVTTFSAFWKVRKFHFGTIQPPHHMVSFSARDPVYNYNGHLKLQNPFCYIQLWNPISEFCDGYAFKLVLYFINCHHFRLIIFYRSTTVGQKAWAAIRHLYSTNFRTLLSPWRRMDRSTTRLLSNKMMLENKKYPSCFPSLCQTLVQLMLHTWLVSQGKNWGCNRSVRIMGCLALKKHLQWKCISMGLFMSLHGHMAEQKKTSTCTPNISFEEWLVIYYQSYSVLMTTPSSLCVGSN